MKNRFTIGEMAKIHNTPVKTLRYYDEIDLFKPIEVNKENGYRYYSTAQFEELNTINYLKFLGIPLKSIKDHLSKGNIDDFLDLLEAQKKETDRRIRELEKIKNRFENRIEEINEARKITNIGEVFTKNIKKRNIIRLKESINSIPQLEISIRKLENKFNMKSNIFIGRVGLTVSKENLEKGYFNKYNSVFVLMEDEVDKNIETDSIKEGLYVCIYYRGNHSESEGYYKKIEGYLKENNYKIIGDSMERTIIDQFISKEKEDYLTEIQIPIESY
ncbi:MerR family transcriptional regulator [Anaeromicrobium sediminis]|uniref:MerR family transcriptional regulator n=1 Tax=Anaeromicrobium sediminis TaxID=1478221 RepID=A0A267MJL8_9FIRM|nr:MerR family transcriptional regulator [Anaeromicrobium sediminis]PAB59791.1 MerR family transcriptional regulator [Anaeromicrobium sediminis]